jgi:hypothetical protein
MIPSIRVVISPVARIILPFLIGFFFIKVLSIVPVSKSIEIMLISFRLKLLGDGQLAGLQDGKVTLEK